VEAEAAAAPLAVDRKHRVRDLCLSLCSVAIREREVSGASREL
jgi:hypothetical protein